MMSTLSAASRLNHAVPALDEGIALRYIIWIGSSSTSMRAKTPMVGPYFAAKAAQDSLAQSYAHELTPWGIETTIVSPGVFTKGTNHFQDAAQPGYPEVASQYRQGPTKGYWGGHSGGHCSHPSAGCGPTNVRLRWSSWPASRRGEEGHSECSLIRRWMAEISALWLLITTRSTHFDAQV